MGNKRPESVLVILHTEAGETLLLERADHPDWWKSVTGSLEADESPAMAAVREVEEETGYTVQPHQLQDWHEHQTWEIYACFRHRYPPGTTMNTEHVFSVLLPGRIPVRLAPAEHLRYSWQPLAIAAGQCFSPTNQAAIRRLAEK